MPPLTLRFPGPFLLFLLAFMSSSAQQDLPIDTNTEKDVPRFETGPGLENFSDRASFPGGNYLYLNGFFNLSEHLSLSAKYSTDLTPKTFDTRVISGGVRFTSAATEVDSRFRASLLYLHHLNEKEDHLGLRVCLLSHQDERLSADFLPITVTYQMQDGRFALIYELLAFGVRF